ncbi:ABC transporter substrate-binding protein [Prauserella cavernicola]|uniref:ABC transporter substrate-binding protein n=1 Tax=Prauserella cavernicola TaxID=2800127 RepID=A0A934QN07_9PSEU|nr:ABC transporter substrate-binding protein [Prauserella cavernicola]MBK1783165.1 ABC transporter substrate-binding protein [Prauserella cavernicola]
MRGGLPWKARACGLVVVALVAAGCGTSSSGESGTPASGDVTVETDQGPVSIPSDPEKVVVLNSGLTGYLYALDVPVTATIPVPANGTEDGFSEFWADEATAAGTTVLPWSPDGFDFEAILAQEPDVIIGGGQGMPAVQAAEVYDRLTDIAPTVLLSNELTTWDEQLSFLGEQVFGKQDELTELMDAYTARAEEIESSIARPEGPVTYLLMTAERVPYLLPEDSDLPSLMADLGFEAEPVTRRHPELERVSSGDSLRFAEEQLGELVSTPTVFVVGFHQDVTSDELAGNPLYAGLPAFEADRAFDLPDWTYRADYQAVMATLDHVAEQFAA